MLMNNTHTEYNVAIKQRSGGVQVDPTWSGGEVGECGEAGLASRVCAGGEWGGGSSWICFWFLRLPSI